MAEKTNEERAAAFRAYNPYIAQADALTTGRDGDTIVGDDVAVIANCVAGLAYEVARLRTELHFTLKGGRSS